jgi:hypothetical protein
MSPARRALVADISIVGLGQTVNSRWLTGSNTSVTHLESFSPGIIHYQEGLGTGVVAPSKIATNDTAKTGNNNNRVYERGVDNDVLYLVYVALTEQEHTQETDFVLRQNQISRRVRLNTTGTGPDHLMLYANMRYGANHLTALGPDWNAPEGSHGASYCTGKTPPPGSSCIMAWNNCSLHSVTEPTYQYSYWAEYANYRQSLIAGGSSPQLGGSQRAYNFGLYVRHDNNMTPNQPGSETYVLRQRFPRLQPELEFVIWRGSSRPTIADYKYREGSLYRDLRPMARNGSGEAHPTGADLVLTDPEGFALRRANAPAPLTRGNDYTETNRFHIRQTSERGFVNGVVGGRRMPDNTGVGAEDLTVTAQCRYRSGHGHAGNPHTGTIQFISFTFNANVAVHVFSDGVKTASATQPLGRVDNSVPMAGRDIDRIDNNHASRQRINGLPSFQYHPFVNMTYETLGTMVAPPKRNNVYALSRYESNIAPQNYIDFGRIRGMQNGGETGDDGTGSLVLGSELWSTHREVVTKPFGLFCQGRFFR